MKQQNLKLTDVTGEEFVQAVPPIKGARPVGTQILVELLTPQEILGTKLHINQAGPTISGAPQAYILAIGPVVDEKWGLKVGDRVVLSGNHTPLPEQASTNGRALSCVEPHAIKAILEE